jgi:hypothetical protein
MTGSSASIPLTVSEVVERTSVWLAPGIAITAPHRSEPCIEASGSLRSQDAALVGQAIQIQSRERDGPRRTAHRGSGWPISAVRARAARPPGITRTTFGLAER